MKGDKKKRWQSTKLRHRKRRQTGKGRYTGSVGLVGNPYTDKPNVTTI